MKAGEVSIPRRYAKNAWCRSAPYCRFRVSIPRRYAKNPHSLANRGRKGTFQSLVGTLKTAQEIIPMMEAIGFQSLVGTLKTLGTSRQRAQPYLFQSLVGTLKTWGEQLSSFRSTSFNPS